MHAATSQKNPLQFENFGKGAVSHAKYYPYYRQFSKPFYKIIPNHRLFQYYTVTRETLPTKAVEYFARATSNKSLVKSAQMLDKV